MFADYSKANSELNPEKTLALLVMPLLELLVLYSQAILSSKSPAPPVPHTCAYVCALAPVAVPRAYWLNDKEASVKDQMLVEPNEGNYYRILEEAEVSGAFDMEVLNHLFRDSAMILPHRRIALLIGELRAQDHGRYMSEDKDEEWNAIAEASRACLVHFSDWPLPKPWLPHSDAQWKSALPVCRDDDVPSPGVPILLYGLASMRIIIMIKRGFATR